MGEATYQREFIKLNLFISIHASRGGSDEEGFCLLLPPLHFNPRFPWGKRPWAILYMKSPSFISIHASRGGSDPASRPTWRARQPFQSTLPVGEATLRLADCVGHTIISIHASRGGSDLIHLSQSNADAEISIHASRGGSDRGTAHRQVQVDYFNPRFPWGKRPAVVCCPRYPGSISIHASRGGSDATLISPK